MRVSQSSITFSSDHRLSKVYEKTEDLHFWDNRSALAENGDEAILSPTGLELSRSSSKKKVSDADPYIEPRYYVLARLIANLTGKDIKILVPGKDGKGRGPSGAEAQTDQANAREGWGLAYSSIETYTEEEQTAFSAKGTITADGKEYAFSVSLLMERSYSISESIDLRAGDALKDPLVVNLGLGPVDLSGKRIKFDIDMDGSDEEMPVPGGASGFLVIDKNGNGIVDDGSELFGPSSGDGYGELAAYDEDKNGWIDEGDSAFARLSVWRSDGESESLQRLSELNIGALYTGSASTPFEIKDDGNETEAKIQKTGIYLREDGTVGTTQKIDLAL
ncbi:MAG TPA: hypothetical protein VGJ94_08090 [Syntrophorhabdaceae bacterium]|jgi:hypothetical protein